MTPGPGLLIRIALLVLITAAAIGTPADADLWGHLTFGRDIVAAADVHRVDPYSFTSDRSWVNHEWLSEVAFFLAYRTLGDLGLITLKVLIIAVMLALVWRALVAVRTPAGITTALIVLAFAGTYWRTHTVRPQLFSVLGFAIVLAILIGYETGRRRRLWAAPGVMALWVNLHGGWIVGLAALAIWIAVRLVDRTATRAERITLTAVGITSAAATLVNPYGWRLWAFLAETVRFQRADIQDWESILTHPLLLGVPWAITAVVAMLAFRNVGSRPSLDRILIAGGLALASLRVSRLDAFFTLAVVMLLASRFAKSQSAARETSDSAPAGPQPAAIGITALASTAMLLAGALVSIPRLYCLPVDDAWAPDREAARFIALNRLEGRMLTWFDWGEYAIWYFGPRLQVSIDGRRETVYSDAVVQAHRRFYQGEQPAAFLGELAPDYVWLPARLPVVARIAEAGWTPVFRSPLSVVFARSGDGFTLPAPPRPVGVRCFPGP